MELSRVYHFVSRDFGLSDIVRRHLKVATITDLNDPFELRAMAFGDRVKRLAIARWRKQISRQVGLLCFSTDWHNPVQWSHYADKHTGICLGFDIPKQFLLSVKYQAKLHPDLVSDAVEHEAGESAVLKLLSTKYSHWRYEREVRMFVDLTTMTPEGAFYFQPFDDDLRLREVIVGAESTTRRQELLAALGGLGSEVTLVKARLAFRTFRVVRQMDESRWT